MSQSSNQNLPKGFHFPAEWAKHTATWLSWPHKEASWPGKLGMIYGKYASLLRYLRKGEIVRINVVDEQMAAFAKQQLQVVGADLSKVEFFEFGTNDAWCRDHGPAFLVNYEPKKR
jgi:agmatine deiminase